MLACHVKMFVFKKNKQRIQRINRIVHFSLDDLMVGCDWNIRYKMMYVIATTVAIFLRTN